MGTGSLVLIARGRMAPKRIDDVPKANSTPLLLFSFIRYPLVKKRPPKTKPATIDKMRWLEKVFDPLSIGRTYLIKTVLIFWQLRRRFRQLLLVLQV